MELKLSLAYFFEWWFIEGPSAIWRGSWVVFQKTLILFSVKILLLTLFLPWKKDTRSTENLALDEKFRVLIENLISRGIGFIVRTLTIITGLTLSAVILTAGILLLIAFIVWPFLSAILIGRGLALLL